MKIGYVDLLSITDRSASSGLTYSVAAALDQWCGDVIELGPFPPSEHFPLRHQLCNQLSWTLLRKTLYWEYSRPCMAEWAHRVQVAVERSSCDIVFTAERSRWAVALLKTAKPIVVFTDSTMRSTKELGGYFIDDLPAMQVARAARTEQVLYRKARTILVASEWARNSVVNDYGISPDRVAVLPFGANLLRHEVPAPEDARRRRSSDECRLLWLGGNWHRKGGDRAVLIRDELDKLGISARLTLVGSDKGPSIATPRVQTIGPLDKSNPDQARQLWEIFRSSDFHLLPTRAETFGIACAEANAFGLPTIAPALGGLPEVVRHDVNGILMAPDATPTEYARRIAELHANPDRYRRLSDGARLLFETVHNWDTWGQRADQELTKLGRGDSGDHFAASTPTH